MRDEFTEASFSGDRGDRDADVHGGGRSWAARLAAPANRRHPACSELTLVRRVFERQGRRPAQATVRIPILECRNRLGHARKELRE